MTRKMNKVSDPSKKVSPIPKVTIRGKETITGSNLRKKPAVNKVVDASVPKIHGKPVKRIMRTSIKAVKTEETKNVQNKRIWLRKVKNATDPKRLKKASSQNLVKNVSINQKKLKITKR
jgi:hypothetical protein